MFKSIQTRIMFYLLPFCVILSIILVSILIYSEYSLFNKDLNKNLLSNSRILENCITTIVKSSKISLEDIDYSNLVKDDTVEYSIVSNNKLIYGTADFSDYNFNFTSDFSFQKSYKNQLFYRALIKRISLNDFDNSYIIMELPDAKAAINKNNVITLTVILLLIAFIISWIYGKKISFSIQRPIKNLSNLANQMANGKLNTEIYTDNNDELHDIAMSFNKLQDNLKSTMKEILLKTGETAEMNEIIQYVHNSGNHLPTGIIGVDNSGIITIFNEQAQQISMIPSKDILGKNINNPLPVGIHNLTNPLRSCLSLGRIKLKTITEIYNPSNDKITVLYSTIIQFDQYKKVVGALVLFKRIEDIERFEKSAEQNRSLQYLGEISASLAHEMRNPLTSIKGYTQYLQMVLVERKDIQDELTTIMNETDRLNSMLGNFLKFAKPEVPKKEATNLNSLISYVLNFMRAEIPNNIKIIEHFNDIPDVMIDVSQFESVLLNLFINSIHAMPSGGTLTVKTFYSLKRKMVILEVNDTGVGIPKDFAEKIFMPFSTTKNDGTGLGLAICSRIIDAHNGIIEVESKEGNGCKFTILLEG